MADFHVFADAVPQKIMNMSDGPLFVVNRDRDAVWEKYLSAFPPGTNEVFRVRREYDCSCCRGFIRDVGCVVTIQNGSLSSVWDISALPGPFQTVADTMSAYVKSLPVRDVFLTPFCQHGTAVSHEKLEVGVRSWNHFSVLVPRKFVVDKGSLDAKLGDARTNHQMLLRAVRELTPEAVSTTIDLINGGLYRGQEFLRSVEAFRDMQKVFAGMLRVMDADLLAWTLLDSPAARFRNSVIGSLVQDLSDNMDMEAAVRRYEAKVAPANYKRPTALITPRTIQSALAEIREMGLEDALERRARQVSDVDVNSVLFVDNSVRGTMRGGLEDRLMQEVKPLPFNPDRAEAISIADFVERVLPKTSSLQLHLHNEVLGSMMSLTAPVHEGVGRIFRWRNDFAWSYDGNVTDSIKDRVKRAGGKVEGVAMRFSLAWRNTDDLDIHVLEPNGNRIFFGDKGHSSRGGYLDVDMNVFSPVRDAVENVRWVRPPNDGMYKIIVNNYTKRESVDVGFEVEVESANGVSVFSFDKALANKASVLVATATVARGKIISLVPGEGITGGSAPREKWGLKGQSLVKVNSVVRSPNYWGDNAVGNQHWFFILEGCKNPDPARGIYNEFLHPRWEKHRKVFEVLGDKTKCPVAEEQMSGVGFSSTRRDKVAVVATGPRHGKTYTVEF